MSNDNPLAGLRLIEISDSIAGAYAGKLFADAGADVILIEPAEGHPLRHWKASAELGLSPPLKAGETGALFHYLHGHKRSCTLDCDSHQGRQQLADLAAAADLVIVDRREATPEWQAWLRSLHQQHPHLNLTVLSNWGADGPHSDRAANEFTLQAEVGATAYRGYPDRPPLGASGQIGEWLGGASTALAALAAYMRQPENNGAGQSVDVSLFETLLLYMQPYQYVHSQLEPGVSVPRSVEVPSIEPSADGWVGLCTNTDKQWQALATLIGHPQLGTDPRMAYSNLRFQHLSEVGPKLQSWSRAHTAKEILALCSQARIPAAPVGNGRTVLTMEQMQARDLYQANPVGFQQPKPPYYLQKGQLLPAGPGPDLNPANAPSPCWKERSQDRKQSLSGLKVVDFTAFWAGPFASIALALLGADVIKIESIQRPDGMRFAAGMPADERPLWEISPITHAANSNKRAVTLDLEQPAGLELVKRLIADADIVIENFSPRVMERFGLDWPSLKTINPELIMVRMPAFGLEGPWRDRTGFAATMEQVSGLAWLTGYPDRSPLIPRGCVDPLGGTHAVFATLSALRMREQGHGGQLVEVPLLEPGLAIAAEQVVEYTAYGALLERKANRAPNACPQGVFQGSDGEWLAISVSSDRHWQSLAAHLRQANIQHPLLNSDVLDNRAQRHEHEDALEALLSEYCRRHPAAELADKLSRDGVPAAFLANVRDLHGHPQLHSAGFFTRLQHAVAGELDYPNLPYRFDGKRLSIRRPAPLLGEHSREILQQRLGLSDEEIQQLEVAQVIGTRPTFM